LTNFDDLRSFILQPQVECDGRFSAASIFSGAGLSDLGYSLSGFRFILQVEQHARRAEIGQVNFPESYWMIGDVKKIRADIVEAFREQFDGRLDLLTVTPPCQGMSSSNPSRGRRKTGETQQLEKLNRLILELIPLARDLNPRVIVAENIRQVLTLEVDYDGLTASIPEHLQRALDNYAFYFGVINVADYGVPQDRRRALIVGVRRNEPCLSALTDMELAPWPAASHSEGQVHGLPAWNSVGEWLDFMGYETLNSGCRESARGVDPLHFVPHYSGDRYLLVSDIPPNSGKSAYENDSCPSCDSSGVRTGVVKCPRGHLMRNRPLVREGRKVRLIKGFKSSYRRIDAQLPARTITTNSSHIGSDFKIHPREHRVLSILECADLQTVPRFWDWSLALQGQPGRKPVPYLIRNLVGEAFPPYYTYLHGRILGGLLSNDANVYSELASLTK